MSFSGKYSIKNPQKYRGDPSLCIYRSSWERKFMKYCDGNPNILSWSSEEVVVPYVSPVDGKIHRYFVDFWIEVRQNDGNIQKFLIEVKPFHQTNPPKQKKRLTEAYINAVQTYVVNQAKWKAASEFCDSKGWKFIVLTEKDLFKNNPPNVKRT